MVFPEIPVKMNEFVPLLTAAAPDGPTRYSRPQFDVQVPRYLFISPFAPARDTIDVGLAAAAGFFAGPLSVAQPAANTVSDEITKALLKFIIYPQARQQRGGIQPGPPGAEQTDGNPVPGCAQARFKKRKYITLGCEVMSASKVGCIARNPQHGF
jgi:hypothetical protein